MVRNRIGDSENQISMVSLQNSIEHLASTVERQTAVLSSLPDKDSIQGLSDRLELFMDIHSKSLPMSLVMLMFATLLGVLFGKEFIEYIFGALYPH